MLQFVIQSATGVQAPQNSSASSQNSAVQANYFASSPEPPSSNSPPAESSPQNTPSPADASAPADNSAAAPAASEPAPFDDLPAPPSGLLLPTAASDTRAAPTAEEQSFADSVYHFGDTIVIDHGVFRAAYQQPLTPLQPLQPVQPQNITPTEPTLPGGALSPLAGTSIAELAAAVGGSPVQGVGQAQAQSIAPTDLGALLQSANSVQSVNTTRRSPVALAPNIRGYEFNEIYSQANGAYWFPVREDLDSMLSKVDPGMVQSVVVIPGPYGVQYGPGLSFIDIELSDTPRYDDGPGSDYRANGDIRTNGGQLYGRLTAEGGSDDYGYRISYGHRTGDDYTAGNGLSIPSSYDSGDVWAQYGFNTGKYQKVEWSFLRLDQGLTNYAAQFFDVNTLETMGTTLRAVDTDPASPWTKAVLEGWWNRTNFTGSITDSKRDPNFPVIQRVEFSLDQEIGGVNTVNGNTLGDNTSAGAGRYSCSATRAMRTCAWEPTFIFCRTDCKKTTT